MPNKHIITQLISKLDEYLTRILFLQKYTKEEFLKDWQIETQIDRMLQLVIECSIDLGEEVLSGIGSAPPSTYRETFLFLHQKNVIGFDVMKGMQELCEFRNELVHDYLYLDPERVYDEFTNVHSKVSAYVKEVKQFLRSSSET